ncbi:MAG: hypothetical protein R2706_17225 [Acidimicrobiales bacterium]
MTEPAPAEIPLSGTLDQVALKQILEVFGSSGATGAVKVGDSGAVWCDAGRLVLATSAASPALADVLFGAGVGTLDELASLLANSSDIGAQLSAQHPSAMPTVARLIHEHNLNALFELLVPSAAPYRISMGESHPLGVTFAEPLAGVIDQAEQRLAIWRQIAARIPSTSVKFRLAAELPSARSERTITADEWRYLAQLDGRRSVADLINATGESAFRVCSGLYRLLLEGIIVDG